MSRLLVLVSLVLLLPETSALRAQQERRRTLEDYFKMLPEGVLEGEPSRMWAWAQKMPGAVFEVANGYLRAPGDGAQGDFEVALFRYQDDRPLLAVCQGEPGESDYWYLHFYALGEGGKLVKVDRGLLPPGNEPRRKFELPRKGRTIVVSDTQTKKVLSRWTWDGGKFVREK
jgi:hypothetical protein